MTKRAIWVMVVLLALAGIYARAVVVSRPQGSPEGQVRGAVMDAVDALTTGTRPTRCA